MADPLVLRSSSPEVTEDVGVALAHLLAPGDLVLLRGEVGAGKTTLVRGIARGLGVTGPVTSPTFTLAQHHPARIPLLHIDAYRLAGADDEELGLLLDGAADALTCVEWPQALAGALPPARVVVDLEHVSRRTRTLRFSVDDPPLTTDLGRSIADIRARHVHDEPEPGDHR